MASRFNPSQFSQTVRSVRDKLQDEGHVTAALIVAGILTSHPEYGNHLASKLKLDTERGEQRPVDDWLMDVMNSYAPDLLEQFGQKVIDGRLVIRALARIDTTLLNQDLMEPFLMELEKEINPIVLEMPVFNAAQTAQSSSVNVSDGVKVSKVQPESSAAASSVVADKKIAEEQEKPITDQRGFNSEGMKFEGTVTVQRQPLELRAGYWADGEMGKDQLDLDTEVNTLAAVLCDDKITPPLSVGLFGDWGSGKSFFMHLLRKRVAMLAEAARGAEERKEESFFCAHVRQITFNSWHYSDANLWASLVTHIFDSLAVDEEAEESGRRISEEKRAELEEQRNDLLKELHSAKVLKRELKTAEARNEDIDKKLGSVIDAFYQQTVSRVLEDSEGEQDKQALGYLSEIKSKLGLSGDPRVEDIQAVVNDSRRLWRSLLTIWLYMKPRQHALTVVWAFVVFLFVVVALRAQVQFNIQQVFGAALITLASWAGILVKPLQALKSVASDAAALLDDLERRRGEEAGRLQREKARLEERIKNLEHDYEALTTGGRFAHLVEERSQGDTYRKELGVISMIHRDFRQMSDLLLQGRDERRVRMKASGTEDNVQEQKEDAPKIPRIDRIILYIDDLDRCDADRVVKVLEAVHLLMAEPLFVVVVGVDPRWLLRSLEKHYTGLLTTNDGVLNPDVAADWQSTPMNYLEKIFQIPYTLKPMSKTGFEKLMSELVPLPETEITVDEKLSESDEFKRGLVTRTTGKPVGDDWQEKFDEIPDDEKEAILAEDENTLQETMQQIKLAGINVKPVQLLIDSRELEFMKKLRHLIGTPRAAKRLSNIYRLLRASLNDQELHKLIEAETGSGEYPAVQVLLAIVVGYPRLATFVFQKLYYSEGIENWDALLNGLEPRDAEEQPLDLNDERGKDGGVFHNSVRPKMFLDEAKLWSRLCRRLDRVKDEVRKAKEATVVVPQDLGLYRKWVLRVARYSFHTGRLVVSNQEEG